MFGNMELFALLLPDDIREKLLLLDSSLSPEEQFNGFMELVKDETGLEVNFDKEKSLRENLQPILKAMSFTERASCNKLLDFVEEKIKQNGETKLLEKDSGKEELLLDERSENFNTSNDPNLLFFK